MRSFLDIAARNERDHAEALALREEQLLIMAAYRDELEDHLDIAAGMIAVARGCSKAAVLDIVACEYETRRARKAAVTT